ncbi:MAG TPA: TIGR03118 family protein [Steroidobacteraceae bacterium]|nr:TIGR03118 family protein [Steroidobacteraceae bacterium]
MFLTRGRQHSWERVPVPLVSLALLLASCGGGGSSGYSGGGNNSGMGSSPTVPPASVMLSIQPTSIVAGQSATLTWSTQSVDSCTASAGWTVSQASGGTATVTPTAAGTVTYTLTCMATAAAVGAYGMAGAPTSGATSATATLTVTPASTFSFTSLVSDTSGTGALTTDPDLVNPWGIVLGPGTPMWTANNHSETSTLYDGNGKAQPTSGPLVVGLPKSASNVAFDPTGIAFNATTDFVVSAAGKSGAAKFIFSGEGGMIAGWSPTVSRTSAITMYTDAGGAVYKGLAIATNGTANFLYATDFHNAKIDLFDATYARQTLAAGKFVDPNLPAGYSPFGIQAAHNGAGGTWQIYVTYAMAQPPDNHDNMNGAGLGLIDIYDAAGTFVKRLVSPGGALNAPWGLAPTPPDFGTLSNVLLVGNFGDGKINGYDASSGQWIGTIIDSTGAAFSSPGLWGIAFGNDAANQPHNTLFYAAGPNDEANGVYGRIDLGAAPTLNAPPVVTLTVPSGTLTGSVTLTATAQDPIAIAKIQFLVGTTPIGTATTSPFTVQWDTTTVTNGSVSLTAVATDSDGNVGTSAAVTAAVSN